MYKYDDFDQGFLEARNAQFRQQVARRLSGALTEDEFRPLRLMNGVYLQLHAYMLRVAIPYGSLNSKQMLGLANIADRWDKGYGHFTTRQNIQFNWPELVDIPDILDSLAELRMHAVQTSGNTIRNVTADHLAGAAPDEVADPRPYAELIRQWSTDHPEFQFLPRKFKIAVSGSDKDRTVLAAHDIGLQIRQGNEGLVFKVLVGGGLGRTPILAKTLTEDLPERELLTYLEAILHAYNLLGRRDNKYKARIKILVKEHGIDVFRQEVEAAYKRLQNSHPYQSREALERIKHRFTTPDWIEVSDADYYSAIDSDAGFREWVDRNVEPHRRLRYASVTVSLKRHGETPGDATSAQMRTLAEIALRWCHDELRVSHEQNIILPHVPVGYLHQVYKMLSEAGLATSNAGLVSDLIACPGMDYCTLATARSIPIATALSLRFKELGLERTIGDLKIKISGCINACGHHHVGHIGILGMDRGGKESYQITLGGDAGAEAALGVKTGRGFGLEEIVPAIEALLRSYLILRSDESERFIDAYRRLGPAPFLKALYGEEFGATSDVA